MQGCRKMMSGKILIMKENTLYSMKIVYYKDGILYFVCAYFRKQICRCRCMAGLERRCSKSIPQSTLKSERLFWVLRSALGLFVIKEVSANN